MPRKNINIDTSELKEMLETISAASITALKLVDAAITEAAYDIDNDLKETLQKGSRSGNTYNRGPKNNRASVTHQASAKGEAPKTDTGRLVSSIRPITSFMAAEVGSLSKIAKYGVFLEPDRPWLSTVDDKHKPLIARRINNAIIASGFAS